jgi:hypothetical protein
VHGRTALIFSFAQKLEKPAIPYVASDSGVIVVVLLNIAVFAAAVLWFIFMKNKYKFFYSAQTGRYGCTPLFAP